eukprot:89285-Chlamydomonas_euryale.AAC.3
MRATSTTAVWIGLQAPTAQMYDMVWCSRAGGLQVILLHLLVLWMAGFVQPLLVCDWQLGCAAHPALGLVNGALCDDVGVTAEDREVLYPPRPVAMTIRVLGTHI